VVSTPINHASLDGLDWAAPDTQAMRTRELESALDEAQPVEPEGEEVAEPVFEAASLVDRDSFHEPSPPPVFTTADASYEDEEVLESAQQAPVSRPFSDSIFNDPLFTDPLFVDSDTPAARPGRAAQDHERSGHERSGRERSGRARSHSISDTLITSDEFEE
jgi:hypothetical protein